MSELGKMTQVTRAMTVFEHYSGRLAHFMLDVLMLSILGFLLLLFFAILHCFVLHSNDTSFLVFEIGVPVLLGAFLLQYFRARNNYAGTGLIVVDRQSERVSSPRAACRALAYLITCFLVPVHLVLIASGSRRMLHDWIAGTHVIGVGEDLKTSIYPPAKPWLAIGLVVASVSVVCSYGQMSRQFEEVESFVTPLLLGRESQAYLTYLKVRYLQTLPELEVKDHESARLLLTHYQAMRHLQHKYYGYDSNYSVRILYSTALISAKAQNRGVTETLIKELKTVPREKLVDAGVKDRVFLEFLNEDPQKAGEYLFSKYSKGWKAG